MRKLGVLTVLTIGIFFVVQNAQAITIIPPSFEFQVKPGETIKTKIKLFNEEQQAKQLYSDVTNFTAQGETGNPQFDLKAQRVDLSAWIDVGPGPYPMQAGDRIEVPITINVPKDAEPGGHYAAVFFTTKPPDTEESGSIGIASAIGSLFLVRVEGEIREQGSLIEFSVAEGKTLFSRAPIDFFVRFSNTGNVHLRPTGTLTIKNMFGGTSDTIDVNPGKGATLPGQIRKYEVKWERGQVQAGTGSAWSDFWKEFSNEWNNFAIGKYTASLALTYGITPAGNASGELDFWVLPWHVLLVSLFTLAIVVVLLIFFIKRYNAWIIRKAKQ